MKLKKIDPNNLPKGKILAVTYGGTFVQGSICKNQTEGCVFVSTRNCGLQKVTHYIELSEIEYE